MTGVKKKLPATVIDTATRNTAPNQKQKKREQENSAAAAVVSSEVDIDDGDSFLSLP